MITIEEFYENNKAELAQKYFNLEEPVSKKDFVAKEFEAYRKTNLLKLINPKDEVAKVLPEIANCDITLLTIQSVTRDYVTFDAVIGDYVTFDAVIGGSLSIIVKLPIAGFCTLTGAKNNE